MARVSYTSGMSLSISCNLYLVSVKMSLFECPAYASYMHRFLSKPDSFGRTRVRLRRGKNPRPSQGQSRAQGGGVDLEASRSFRREGCPGRGGGQHEKGGGPQSQRKGLIVNASNIHNKLPRT